MAHDFPARWNGAANVHSVDSSQRPQPATGGIFALFQQMSYWTWGDHEYFASRKLLTLGNFQLPGAAVNTLAATAPFRKVVWGGA